MCSNTFSNEIGKATTPGALSSGSLLSARDSLFLTSAFGDELVHDVIVEMQDKINGMTSRDRLLEDYRSSLGVCDDDLRSFHSKHNFYSSHQGALTSYIKKICRDPLHKAHRIFIHCTPGLSSQEKEKFLLWLRGLRAKTWKKIYEYISEEPRFGLLYIKIALEFVSKENTTEYIAFLRKSSLSPINKYVLSKSTGPEFFIYRFQQLQDMLENSIGMSRLYFTSKKRKLQ